MKEILAVALNILGAVGCAAQPPSPRVSWAEIQSTPQSFDGSRVAICGWFAAQLELCSLFPKPTYWGKKEAIWIFPEGDWCSMDQVATKPFEGWAEIDGVVHWGASYGHFGMWEIAMDHATVSPIDTPCDVNDVSE